MANGKHNLKAGMAGSNGGRGRWDRTEVLKHESKTLRRRQDKERIGEALEADYANKSVITRPATSVKRKSRP